MRSGKAGSTATLMKTGWKDNPMVVVQKGGVEFYIDNHLAAGLDEEIKKVRQKDEDRFYVIDGGEGDGKSVFAMQLAKYCDPTFNLARTCFAPEEFRKAILAAKKVQSVVFDESFRGLSSRGALTEVNKILVALMMECRQKNLFVFVVMPTFFLLDKYVALWRARGLFHVYRKKGKKGFWVFFNRRKKKLLYLKGKTTYSYNQPKSQMKGHFVDVYAVNEREYRKRKEEAFKKASRSTRAEHYLDHRNTLLWLLNRDLGLSTTRISEECKRLGWNIEHNTISEAITKKERTLEQDGLLAE